MPALRERLTDFRLVAGLILAAAVGTIAGALLFEHVLGLRPCPLCLQQRYPYYAAMPAALATMLLPRPGLARAGLALLALIFLVGAGLGAYHAGVEWGWWPGPSDCAGSPAATPGSVGDFLSELQTTRVVSCTEAAWRMFGLSLAGWNVLISLALAGLALAALASRRAPQGTR